MTRYYEETPCEHGRMQAHGVVGVIHGEGIPECNGGSRRELEDVQIVEAISQWDGVGWQCNLPVSEPGRHLVVRIDGETTQ